MIELTRTVRFCLNDDSHPGPSAKPDAAKSPVSKRSNTFSSWPPMRGLGRYYQTHVTCEGEPDAKTGYFINIKLIDRAFRDHVLPFLESWVMTDASGAPLGKMMRMMIERLQGPLSGTVREVRFDLTPYYNLSMETKAKGQVVIRQQYEFAAAHRLHVPDYSDERNREIFGKCNNPSGHGHNYRLEVAVRCEVDETGQVVSVSAIDDVVDAEVMEKLDHKHLNMDVPEFEGKNPSVEHIAMVIYEMLKGPIEGLADEEKTGLHEVRVWETGKTVCVYRG